MTTKEVYNEKLLIEELTKGNQRAFRVLYDTYRDHVYAYSLSMLKVPVYAEEIVQEVFLRVWIKRAQLNTDFSFKAFLFTITRNATFDFLKKAAYDEKLREAVFYKSQKFANPTDQVIREKDLEHIKQQALDLLPPKRRMIFEMSRNEGKSYAEISKELNISISTVKNQMSKALETIRDFLLHNGDITFILSAILSGWLE